jgi:hypothetical protein
VLGNGEIEFRKFLRDERRASAEPFFPSVITETGPDLGRSLSSG